MGALNPSHIVGAARPTPDRAHVPSQLAGVVHRTCPKMPKPHKSKLKELRRATDRVFDTYLRPLDESEIIPFADYVQSLAKPQSYKDSLIQYHNEAALGVGHIKGKRTMASFTKDECYDEYKQQRGIQGTSKDSFKKDIAYYYGRNIRSIEDFLYARLPCNVKHTTPKQRMEMVKLFSENGLATSDYSSFEASHSADLLDHSIRPILNRLLGATTSHELIEIYFKWVLTGDKILKFRNGMIVELTTNVEMSGDSSTSLANYLLNYLVWVTILLRNGKTLHEIETMLIIEGDDVLADPKDAPVTATDFFELGLIAKIQTNLTKNEAGFCQLFFSGDTICADPLKKLVSFSRIPERYLNAGRKCHNSLLRAQGLSMLSLHNGSPIVHELALAILRITKGYTVRDNHVDTVSYAAQTDILSLDWRTLAAVPVTSESRLLVEEVFRIPIETQLIVESKLKAWNGGPLRLPLEFPTLWCDFYDLYTRQ
jgi:hypothetical protein